VVEFDNRMGYSNNAPEKGMDRFVITKSLINPYN